MKKLLSTLGLVALLMMGSACSDKADPLKMELIPVKRAEQWGYVDKQGINVINPQFSQADFFRDGLALVRDLQGKVGFINAKGTYEITPQYLKGLPFSEGLTFVVSEGGAPTCIDKAGRVKFVMDYARFVCPFSEGLAVFGQLDEQWNIRRGYIDKEGKVVISPQFEKARAFSEGFSAIRINEKWGFIDKTGKIVVNPQYDEIRDFKNGKAAFYRGKQAGYIDTQGREVITAQFDKAEKFAEEKAAVRLGKTYGYIDLEGKIAINPQFDSVANFRNGLALVKMGKQYAYIDSEGKIVINPQYDAASSFYDGVAFVRKGSKWGIIDKEGKYLAQPQFDRIEHIIEPEPFFWIESETFNPNNAIAKFFEKAKGKTFDGFHRNSTLNDITKSRLYGKELTVVGDGTETNYESGADNQNYLANSTVIFPKPQQITEDVSINRTLFHFNNRISYRSYSYFGQGAQQYNYNERIAMIAYEFDLTGKAEGKQQEVASAIKSWIERNYEMKFVHKVDEDWGYQYDIASGKDFTYVVYLGDDEEGNAFLDFFVAFDKQQLLNRFASYFSGD